MVEIWKDIIGFEGLYQISDLGRIKSLERNVYSKGGCFLKKERILKPGKDGSGYHQVCIRNYKTDNKKKNIKIHQAVAIAFLRHITGGYKGLVIDHINNIKTDNRSENLQIISSRYNVIKEIDKSKTTSKYTGVYFKKELSKWIAQITIKNKLLYLGLFDSEDEASSYYNNAVSNLEINKEIKIKRQTTSSQFVGVYYMQGSKKWLCQSTITGKRKHVGQFNTEIEAYNAKTNYELKTITQ